VKLTTNQLKEIVKEEIANIIAEKKLEYGVYPTEKEAKEHIAKAGDTTMKVKEIKNSKGEIVGYKVVEPE
jgi:hypothetical protein